MAPKQPPEDLKQATAEFVTATSKVTELLKHLAAGDLVTPDDVDSARGAEVTAISHYIQAVIDVYVVTLGLGG